MVSQVSQAVIRIRDSIGSVLVGKEDVVELTLAAVLSGGHILVEDVPGIGKTTLARALAGSLDCGFKRIQFTPDLMPSDITGIHYYNQKSGEFEFRPGPIISQVVLADEINRATPRTQAALLEAMGERQLTIDETTIPLPSPFLVIATQNPIELEGTFPLPEAQLDRFLIRIQLGYPDESQEEQMLLRFENADPLGEMAPVANSSDILEFQSMIQRVYVDPVLRNYTVRIAQATRQHPEIELGASPRATLGLHRCSQALAVMRGREYVTPDEIKELAPFALSHRLILKSQARLRERTPEGIIKEILEQVTVPI
ncbi:MAG: MoxR family ATPase [Chloroflexi bacterium]|nr:MoxR family ATPase [Chloroflexota bacterium]